MKTLLTLILAATASASLTANTTFSGADQSFTALSGAQLTIWEIPAWSVDLTPNQWVMGIVQIPVIVPSEAYMPNFSADQKLFYSWAGTVYTVDFYPIAIAEPNGEFLVGLQAEGVILGNTLFSPHFDSAIGMPGSTIYVSMDAVFVDNISGVPEPGTWTLMGVALAVVAWRKR